MVYPIVVIGCVLAPYVISCYIISIIKCCRQRSEYFYRQKNRATWAPKNAAKRTQRIMIVHEDGKRDEMYKEEYAAKSHPIRMAISLHSPAPILPSPLPSGLINENLSANVNPGSRTFSSTSFVEPSSVVEPSSSVWVTSNNGSGNE